MECLWKARSLSDTFKAIPLYQMLKKTDNFVWSDAANEAFEALKRQLAEPPVLVNGSSKDRRFGELPL